MVKSTTTPFSMEMNLESWPPISKMVSTGAPAARGADVHGAGLVRGDLVVDRRRRRRTRRSARGPNRSCRRPDLEARRPSSRSIPRGPAAPLRSAGPPCAGRCRGRPSPSLVDGTTRLVIPSRCRCRGRPRSGSPRGGRLGTASRGRAAAPRCPATAACRRSGASAPACCCRRWISPNDRFARLLRLEHRRADRAAPGVERRGRCSSTRPVRTPRAAPRRRPALQRDRADEERPGGSTVRPLTTLHLKFCATASAQPAQDLGRRVALLLRVDHVGLGEDRAAARRCAPRVAARAHDRAHVLDRVAQPRRLLVEERPGAGRAVAAAVVVGNQRPAARRRRLQAQVPRALAADLEDRPDLGIERARPCAPRP